MGNDTTRRLISLPIFLFNNKKKSHRDAGNRQEEVKKFTSMFNEEARKHMNYNPDRDPVIQSFKEKMKRWREY